MPRLRVQADVSSRRSARSWRALARALPVALAVGCERKPPEPKPLASLAAEAEADGIPFSAACQSWKVSDFEARTNEPTQPSVARERLDAIWKLMLRHHLDPTLACLDWPRVHGQQVKELGTKASLEAVDEAFASVFSQLGPEAPRLEAEGRAEPAAMPDDRPRLRKSEARLTAYDVAGRLLVDPDTPEAKAPGPRQMKAPIEVPEGMVLEWWALGAWSVHNVKRIEAALRAIKTPAQGRRAVVDLRETTGTSVRAGLRLLNSCAGEPRTIGEITDRKGTRPLQLKPNAKARAADRLIVLTSERSSAVSQLVAYTALTDCGAAWFYETQELEPETFPAEAQRPFWSERAHALPGGGRLWTRSAQFELELRVAGPTPSAELRTPDQLTPERLASVFEEELTADAP